MKYLVFNIGCIECGVSSNIVGVFTHKEKANKIAETLEEKNDWRQGGENRYQVYEINEDDFITEEYREFLNEL